MLGTIKTITEVFGDRMDGYKIETDQHMYQILINNGQQCCESWGCFSSDDNTEQFIGATLREVKLTDVALNQRVVEESAYHEGCGGIQFVDFVTDRGTLQLAVYNAHNGYYGHKILVTVDDGTLLDSYL
jgi:hypothetical protein